MTLANIQQDNVGLSRASIDRAKDQLQLLADFTNEVLVKDADYGTIPGTDKPTLYKPGAHNIMAAMGCYSRARVVYRDINTETGYFYVETETEIVNRASGEVVAIGNGSCTSYERKYRYRNAKPKCPSCNQEAIQRSKFKEEFYCWNKMGGCGAVFATDDTRIAGQPAGMVENADLLDQVNTYLKMAEKRSDVDAALKLPGVARKFTQDIEEDATEAAPTASQQTVEAAPRAKPTNSPPKASTASLGKCKEHNKAWANTPNGIGHPAPGVGQWCLKMDADKAEAAPIPEASLDKLLALTATLEDLKSAVTEQGWQWDEFEDQVINTTWEEWAALSGDKAVELAWKRFQRYQNGQEE